MNFLKESLTRSAVPTLQKDANGQESEVHIDESELAALEYPVQSKQQTIDLPEKDMSRSTQSSDDIESISSVSFDDSDAIECEKTKTLGQAVNRRHARVDEQRASIELPINTYGLAKRPASTDLTPSPSKRIVVKQYKLDKAGSSIQVLKNHHQSVTTRHTPDAETSNSGSMKAHPPSRSSHRASASRVIPKEEDDGPNTDEVHIVMVDPDGNANSNQLAQPSRTEENESTTTIDKELYLHTMAKHTKQIDELKRMLAEKLQSERSQQSVAVSASSSSDVRGEMKVAKGPAMTKIQLFNGIRRYLNPSMVALLRMEIFGGAERDYRPDEKQIAKELFGLNASVYDYMREEWRFRLPSKAQVESWLKEPDDEDIADY